MAKILLLVPGSKTFYGEPRYPVTGLSMIGAVLKNAGHDVYAIDLRLSKYNDQSVKNSLAEFKPSIVGFTVTSWDQNEALRIAKLVKNTDQTITTIFGGPQPSLCPDEIIINIEVDFIVQGEGELTIIELVDALENNRSVSDIHGLVYRCGETIFHSHKRSLIRDLSFLPLPAYELFNLNDYYAKGEKRLGIYSTRGCPYGCIFCTGRTVMGRTIRCRPPEDVISEMHHWYSKAGITHFCFNEDNLLGNIDHGTRLLDLLEKINLPITYSLEVGVRADALTDEICSRLKKTGCSIVAIGIESVDPQVLKLVKKGETIETITDAIRKAKRAGLFVKGYFIVGLPGDTKEKVISAIEYAKKERIDMPRFALAQAFPHTELASWVEQHGTFYYQPYEYVLRYTDECHGDVHYDLPNFSKSEIWVTYLWAHKQAEYLSFKQALIRVFGAKLGYLLNIFNNSLTRKILIGLYQRKLISLPK